jgi:uncharacterized protein (TIGR02147 family)
MKPVFEYLDYREFLKDFQLDRQSRNPAFSIRSFLKRAGIASPSFFKQVVQGERNLTEKTLGQFLSAMLLKSQEADYFRSLVHFCQSETAEEKQLHYERLRDVGSKAKVRIVGEDRYAFYEHWYTPVLRELLCQEPFNDDYNALARRLRPNITASQAKESVKILTSLGFLERKSDGTFAQTDPLLHTGFEVQSLAVRGFNRQMVQLAGEALDRVPVDERNITGVTMSVSERTYGLITEEIRAFQEKILRLVEKDSDADRVCQMNVMLFPVSHPRNKGA